MNASLQLICARPVKGVAGIGAVCILPQTLHASTFMHLMLTLPAGLRYSQLFHDVSLYHIFLQL